MALTQISTAGVKDDAVTAGKIPANAVGSSELADNAVDTAAIANDAVTGSKINANAVGTTQLLDTAVTTAKIADGNVTAAKLASGVTDLSNDSSPQLGGNLDVNGQAILFPDDNEARFGTGTDMKIHHTGGQNYVEVIGDGNLNLKGAGSVVIKTATTKDAVVCNSSGSTDLYHNNVKRFETKSDGARFTGHLYTNDNEKIRFGTGHDYEIYHSGVHAFLKNSTGDLFLAGDSVKFVNAAVSNDMVTATAGGAVTLHHNGGTKLSTTSYGTRTTGYHTQSTAIGFQGDAADWTASQPNMHNMSLLWNSGHLNNSTGVFTCPVAGKYLCSASVQAHRTNTTSGASSTYYNVLWQKNSGNYHVEMVGTSSTDAGARSVSDVNGKHEVVTATIIMDCAANDTIRAHSNHGYRHNTQNICSVYLLG